jgi:hypothetical protein
MTFAIGRKESPSSCQRPGLIQSTFSMAIEGWLARTIHKTPWGKSPLNALQADAWNLYDVKNDFSLAKNLAAEQPAK